jgi:large subunit ribosomal protein L18
MAQEIVRYKSLKTRRAIRVRGKIKASGWPRLSVFRSNKFLYAQVIDDAKGVTLASAKGKVAAEVGKTVAEKAIKAGVTKVVFDRGVYNYHGRVKALAEAAREEGLKF